MGGLLLWLLHILFSIVKCFCGSHMNTVWRVHSSPCVNMVLVVRSLVSMTLLSQDFRPIDVMNTDYRRQATSHTLPFYRCLYLPVFVTSVHSICNSSGQHDTTLNIEINGWFFLLCCHCCSLLFSLFFFGFVVGC